MSIDPTTVAALKDWQHAQKEERLAFGPGYVQSGYVLTALDGTPAHPQSISDAFDAAVKHAGARRIRLHDLRHGHASTLLRHGVPVHVVAKRLGHADPSITLRVYAHSLPVDDDAAVAVFSKAMGL